MRDRSKKPLSDPRPGHRMRQALTTCLGLAVVFAVGEVLVRYVRSHDTFQAAQLSLAVFTSVALLGLIAVLMVTFGALIGRLARRICKRKRFAVVSQIEYGVLAAVVSVLILATDGLSLLAGRPDLRLAFAVSVGMGLWIVAAYVKLLGRPPLSALARGGVVATWVACLGIAAVAALHTQRYLSHWLHAPRTAPSAASAPAPNILVIVVDTLRADRVGVYGDANLTPNLDKFADSSIVYTNALSTAPWTLPAHASLFTGLYPERHGVDWGHYRLDDRFPTLAQLLTTRGYRTFAVSNNWLVSEANGFARGFESFIEISRDPYLSRWRLTLACGVMRPVMRWIGLPNDAAHDAGSAWANWLIGRRIKRHESNPHPFFAFINYFEPHDPYRPPARFLDRLLTAKDRDLYRKLPQREDYLAAHACDGGRVYSEEQVALMSKLYDAEVAYQDEALGRLMQSLNDAGRLDDTWVVVTSDHGELFGEWNMLYHTAGSHYQLLHVPLLVRPPGGVARRIIDAPVQPVDIFATLLRAADLPLPPSVKRAHPLPLSDESCGERVVSIAQTHGASIAGLSMAQRMNLQADLSKWLTWVTSVQADGYLLEMDAAGPRALYDLTVDPMMNENLADLLPDVVDSMVSHYHDWAAQSVCGDVL